jgi:hypothetical protein
VESAARPVDDVDSAARPADDVESAESESDVPAPAAGSAATEAGWTELVEVDRGEVDGSEVDAVDVVGSDPHPANSTRAATSNATMLTRGAGTTRNITRVWAGTAPDLGSNGRRRPKRRR